jgi:Ca2+-binding RTX toxin-like protein
MAYTATGTAGNDTLNQSADTGPGTIIGLAGNDVMSTGTGAATVEGGSGDDVTILQAGNTGQVTSGTENDSIYAATNIGSMLLFGNEGADTITTSGSTNPQSILGGNDSADGPDSLQGGVGNDIIFGNGGDDTLDGWQGADTMIAGVGNDTVWHSFFVATSDLVFANEGNDTVWVSGGGGGDTVFAGQGNDSVFHNSAGTANFFGNEGNDTINAFGASAASIVGGNDSADGNDSLTGSAFGDIIFGNGGADSIVGNGGPDTIIGGFTADTIVSGTAADFIFGNEANDTINTGANGPDTVFAGQGEDSVIAGAGRDTLLGNEGNDTIRGGDGIDTISGGAGADLFAYSASGVNGGSADGDNANAGGPVEFITDLNWAEDRIQTFVAVVAANATGPGAAANLEDAADNAIAASLALAGGGAQRVAATFAFNGRSYVAIDQGGAFGAFTDSFDLLIDITGVTGTVALANFTT